MNTIDTELWLEDRLKATGINTLSNLADVTGIHKGTLSKYFKGTQRPRIDVIGPLCDALQVSPETLLKALKAL